jgi:hypothetical protein
MQSTGQTSKHASQPVQLSALMTANSLGSFLRGPCFAIDVSDDGYLQLESWFSLLIIDGNQPPAKDEFGAISS